MARNLRNRRGSDVEDASNAKVGYETQIKDENGIIHTTTRSLRKINYAEIEKVFDFLEDDQVMDKDETPVEVTSDEHHNNNQKGDDEDDDVDLVSPHENARTNEELTNERNLRKRKAHDPEEDDESFHEEEADEFEDEYLDEDSKDNNRRAQSGR